MHDALPQIHTVFKEIKKLIAAVIFSESSWTTLRRPTSDKFRFFGAVMSLVSLALERRSTKSLSMCDAGRGPRKDFSLVCNIRQINLDA